MVPLPDPDEPLVSPDALLLLLLPQALSPSAMAPAARIAATPLAFVLPLTCAPFDAALCRGRSGAGHDARPDRGDTMQRTARCHARPGSAPRARSMISSTVTASPGSTGGDPSPRRHRATPA